MRFRDSAATLPVVLDALFAQSRKPDLLIGVDNESRDGSRALLAARGAVFVDWHRPYHVSRVLNAGIAACPTDLVLVLSSHTRLPQPDTLARYEEALADPAVAAASHWSPACRRYRDRVTWSEIRAKGMTRGSIYSNSSGCLRRSCWQESPFDERIDWCAEDYEWILRQLRRGRACRLLAIERGYLRPRTPPFIHLRTARMVHAIARRHGLRTAFGDGPELGRALFWLAKTAGLSRRARVHAAAQVGWLWGRATWRWHDPFRAEPGPAARLEASAPSAA
jgi:hypothetical protein